MANIYFQLSEQAMIILYLPIYVLCMYLFIYCLFKGIIFTSEYRLIATSGRVITGRMCKTELSGGMI